MKNTKPHNFSDPLAEAVLESRKIYIKQRLNNLKRLKHLYSSGRISKYDYISKAFDENKILFDISDIINGTTIKNIKIQEKSVVFSIDISDGKDPLIIEIEVDRSARSAPLEILNFGAYEREDEQMVYKLIKKNDTVFDVGAHIGWFSINLAKRFRNVSIHSFEPMKSTYDILRRNVIQNKTPNIIPHNIGLADEPAILDFYFTETGSPLASLKNISDIDKCKRVPCKVTDIDSIIQKENINKINFIKCDVEGAELLVLRGAQKCLRQFTPILLLEIVESWCLKFNYSANDILSALKGAGYSSFVALNGKLKEIRKINPRNTERFNYFFLHGKSHSRIIDKFA